MQKHFAATNNSKDLNLHADGSNPLFGCAGVMMNLDCDDMSGTDCVMLYSVPRDHDYAELWIEEGADAPMDTLKNFTRKLSNNYSSDNCDLPAMYELIKSQHKDGHVLIVIGDFKCNLLAHSEGSAELLFEMCVNDWNRDVKHFEEGKVSSTWWNEEGRPWRADKMARAAANYHAFKSTK